MDVAIVLIIIILLMLGLAILSPVILGILFLIEIFFGDMVEGRRNTKA